MPTSWLYTTYAASVFSWHGFLADIGKGNTASSISVKVAVFFKGFCCFLFTFRKLRFVIVYYNIRFVGKFRYLFNGFRNSGLSLTVYLRQIAGAYPKRHYSGYNKSCCRFKISFKYHILFHLSSLLFLSSLYTFSYPKSHIL